MKKIVITHKNPDFDAIASAYAAYRLYGLDAVVTATSYESAVNEYVSTLEKPLPIVHLREKEIESIESIDLLVITDCKLAGRLEPLDGLVAKAKKVIIYDHHPAHGQDIEAEEMYVEETGSCSAVIVEKMKAQGLTLTPEEATLIMTGIYEDTGMLSFASTTVKDMEAAAWLLSFGANLNEVGEYVKRELSRDHVFILNELLTNMHIRAIGSVRIGISNASNDKYIEDISHLAHKIMDIESLDALFILVRTGDRIVLVGRSRTDDVDASEIAASFGGGGHYTAASAVIKDQMLHECVAKLDLMLGEAVKPVKKARDIMTSPVKTLAADVTFDAAIDIFMKHNLNNMPVVQGKVPVGIVSRRDILQGLKHGLNREPVSSIMQVEFIKIPPDMPYYSVEETMLAGSSKMVIVEDDGKLIGVITRTDLLRLIHDEIAKMPRFSDGRLMKGENGRSKSVAGQMENVLPERVFATLKDIGAMADELGYKCYLVGGVVRDILLKKTNEDIDIVVEGSAPGFAKEFANRMGARAAVHAKFKTAVVIFPDGFRVDFATSRTEFYTFPASAPTVEDASIKNDLFRRDFSINAMAVKLNKKEFGVLLDFFGGQRDLQDKKIRVLHSLSFVDDPSRALRAVRFAVRFDFMIGPHTDRLFRHAVNLDLFERVQGQRMFLELKYILSEKSYRKALRMMRKYDLLKFFHETLRLDERKEAMFDDLDTILDWYGFQFDEEPEAYLARMSVLFSDMDKQAVKEILKRFSLDEHKTQQHGECFKQVKDTVAWLKRSRKMPDSVFARCMDKLETPCAIAVAALAGENYERQVKDFFTVFRYTKPDITGNDLLEMKVEPKTEYSHLLSAVRDAKIDKKCTDRESQLRFVQEMVKNDKKDC
ncbi:MAG: CBS domain-containing protein [Deferribacterales bacterium]